MVTLADGGSVSATAADGTTFELVVPPMAVARDTEISMTPLTDVEGIGDGAVHAVQLEPEGLTLFELVRLTITPATPIAIADQLMFEAAGDGSDPGLALIDPSSEPIVILLEHFSLGGVASVTPQQRATFIEKSASNAERRIAGKVRALIGAERQRQLLGASDDPADLEALNDALEPLHEEFEREVVERRREAAMQSCTALKTYITTLISFERTRQLLGASEAGEAASQERIIDALSAMHARYQQCEEEAIAACKEAKDPAILIEFWLAMARQFGLEVGNAATLQERAEQICAGPDYRVDKTVTATQMNVTFTIQYTGTKCDGVAGTWTIESSGTLSGYGGTAAIGGPLTVEIPPESTEGTLEGTANFDDENQGHTEGHFFGSARFIEEPPTLELTVTGGSGSGYSYGFLDTGVLQPGTLTFPLEKGDFCD
jgi:hypothetical protein